MQPHLRSGYARTRDRAEVRGGTVGKAFSVGLVAVIAAGGHSGLVWARWRLEPAGNSVGPRQDLAGQGGKFLHVVLVLVGLCARARVARRKRAAVSDAGHSGGRRLEFREETPKEGWYVARAAHRRTDESHREASLHAAASRRFGVRGAYEPWCGVRGRLKPQLVRPALGRVWKNPAAGFAPGSHFSTLSNSIWFSRDLQ